MNLNSSIPNIKLLDNNQINLLFEELPPQYELLGKVNEGGMGSIFKAQNRYTSANVAIKLMHLESQRNTDAIKRFYFEAKAASLLKHPSICRLLDFGVTSSGMPYLIMDWIEGRSLEEIVLNDGVLPINESILIFKQVAMALNHAHSKKIVHRDLKPDNIMLVNGTDEHFEVQLVDFGIAKLIDNESNLESVGLTKVGLTVGTPKYMSPEQAAGLKVDNRTDLYSLGCVMYFALAGKPPFNGKNVVETLKMQVNQPPPAFDVNAKIPHTLQAIVYRCLEKEADKRYANMEELLVELDNLIRPQQQVQDYSILKDKILAQEYAAIQEGMVMHQATPRKKISWVVWFVLGFLIMYSISVALQNLSEGTQNTTNKQSASH